MMLDSRNHISTTTDRINGEDEKKYHTVLITLAELTRERECVTKEQPY